MLEIDVISQVCIYNDYPLFRQNLTNYRNKFKKIILYPSRHHGVIDMEEFFRRIFPETWVTGHTIDWTTPGIDWRQEETMPCLALSDAEWVLFMEQDFFCDNWDKLWEDVEKASENADMIGWWSNSAFPYVHPCFLLVKRSMLEKTSKDFRAHPEIDGSDHFAMITHDIQKLGGKIVTLQSLGWQNWENAFHMGGLTYPYQNWIGDGSDIFGVSSPEAFMVYNYYSRLANVEQSPFYLSLSFEVEKRLKELFPILNLQDNRWIKFFQ